MKNFIFNLLFVICTCSLFNLTALVEEKTMYLSCSPYGLCDGRIFENKKLCQVAQGPGHSECRAKIVQIAQNPITGIEVARLASPVSGVITGETTSMTPIATQGLFATARPVITMDTSSPLRTVVPATTTLISPRLRPRLTRAQIGARPASRRAPLIEGAAVIKEEEIQQPEETSKEVDLKFEETV